MNNFLKFLPVIVVGIFILNCLNNEERKDVEIEEEGGVSGGETEETGGNEEYIPPEPIIYESEGVLYAPSVTQFQLKSIDKPEDKASSGVKSIEVSVDGGEFEKYSKPIEFSTEGKHTIKYRATDIVGNVEPIKTQTIVIDDTEPQLAYEVSNAPESDGIKDYLPAGTVFSIDCSDELSGVCEVLVSVNGEKFSEYKSPVEFNDEGSYEVKYKAKDNCGNWALGETLEFIIDGTLPEVEIKPSGKLYEVGDMLVAPSTHKYYLSASDDGSGVVEFLCSIDGGKYEDYGDPVVFSSPGKHTIEAYAIDRVGHKSEVESLVFYVDPSYPRTTLSAFIP